MIVLLLGLQATAWNWCCNLQMSRGIYVLQDEKAAVALHIPFRPYSQRNIPLNTECLNKSAKKYKYRDWMREREFSYLHIFIDKKSIAATNNVVILLQGPSDNALRLRLLTPYGWLFWEREAWKDRYADMRFILSCIIRKEKKINCCI